MRHKGESELGTHSVDDRGDLTRKNKEKRKYGKKRAN